VAVPAALIAMCFWLDQGEPRFWLRLGAGYVFGVQPLRMYRRERDRDFPFGAVRYGLL
jgi:hypothetical protein